MFLFPCVRLFRLMGTVVGMEAGTEQFHFRLTVAFPHCLEGVEGGFLSLFLHGLGVFRKLMCKVNEFICENLNESIFFVILQKDRHISKSSPTHEISVGAVETPRGVSKEKPYKTL